MWPSKINNNFVEPINENEQNLSEIIKNNSKSDRPHFERPCNIRNSRKINHLIICVKKLFFFWIKQKFILPQNIFWKF